MRDAALIAYKFQLDPVAVLAERDDLNALVRLAAVLIVNNEEERANREASKRSR